MEGTTSRTLLDLLECGCHPALSGGVAAYVLTRAGLKVLILEAGRHYDPLIDSADPQLVNRLRRRTDELIAELGPAPH